MVPLRCRYPAPPCSASPAVLLGRAACIWLWVLELDVIRGVRDILKFLVLPRRARLSAGALQLNDVVPYSFDLVHRPQVNGKAGARGGFFNEGAYGSIRPVMGENEP